MTKTSYTSSRQDITYKNFEEYMAKVLLPNYVNELTLEGICPTKEDFTKYKNFVQSGIWSRHASQTKSRGNISGHLDLELKVKLGKKEAQTISIMKKGDNFITILSNSKELALSPGQIDACESAPVFDKENLTDKVWERYLIAKPEPESKLDEILIDLRKT